MYALIRNRFWRAGAVLGTLGLLASLAIVGGAKAQSSDDIDVSATFTGPASATLRLNVESVSFGQWRLTGGQRTAPSTNPPGVGTIHAFYRIDTSAFCFFWNTKDSETPVAEVVADLDVGGEWRVTVDRDDSGSQLQGTLTQIPDLDVVNIVDFDLCSFSRSGPEGAAWPTTHNGGANIQGTFRVPHQNYRLEITPETPGSYTAQIIYSLTFD
jgi:hypothetical protein